MAFTVAQRQRSAAAYRAILRSSRATFGPDLRTRLAFESQFRDLFDRFLPSRANVGDTTGLDGELDSVFEVAKALRRNVVQGLHRQTDSGERIRLRITEETELGDNESIKSRFSSGSLDSVSKSSDGAAATLSEAAQERREKRRQRKRDQQQQAA